MSLLDSGAVYEDILIYPEETVTDLDGNIRTRPSVTGVPAKARFQALTLPGTTPATFETQKQSFETIATYTMRLPRAFTAENGEIGAQAEVQWRGERWSVAGEPRRYGSSSKTYHTEYVVARF